MVDMESKSWQQEMRRQPQPTSSTAINEGNIGNRVNRKRNRTRAALNEEQEDEESENPDNASIASASSVSSNGNNSIVHEEDLCSDSTTKSSTETDVKDRPSTSKPRSASSRNLRSQEISQDWKLACRQLLEALWQCENSIPFREPVDGLEHPEYHQIIDTPMDLRTVKEDLLGDNYETPKEFAKDMKLIFTNSRNFNTNKRSKIYSKTIRLSAMFEDHMHRILLNWKSARRRKSTTKRETKAKRKRKIQKKKPNLSNDTGPSKSKSAPIDSTAKSSTEIDVEDRPSTSKPRSASSRNLRLQQISQDWKLACHKLLEILWQCEDSIYFREPMDRLELPEYYEIIDTPMDLRTVKEYLLGNNYETPAEFAKDIELIFANSRNFNPNKHSSMYSMTIRLSAMFEEHMVRILLNWISAHRREKTTKAKRKRNQKPNLSNDTEPSKSKSAPSDEEMDVDVVGLSEHDDDEVSDKEQKKKNFDISVPGPSQMANGHTKLSNSGPSRPSLKLRICRSTVAKKPKDGDSEFETTWYTDSINSASVGRTKARTAVPSISADTDSGDDYTPGDRSKQVRKNCGKNIKNGKQSKSRVKPNIIADDDNDNDEYVAESKMNEDKEEGEEVILVLDSTEEENEEEKIIKGDTRSRKLTESVQNQKYIANNGKNDNSDSESEEDDAEEQEEQEEEEEEQQQQQLQHKTNKHQDSEDSDYSYKRFNSLRSSRRKQRSSVDSEDTRQQHSSRRSSARKRPCYNEDSDDSTTLPVRNRRKIKRRSYAEDSDESMPDPDISIRHSRGCMRKMTSRARAYLLESP